MDPFGYMQPGLVNNTRLSSNRLGPCLAKFTDTKIRDSEKGEQFSVCVWQGNLRKIKIVLCQHH
jgi:hypothetical protein